jgi:hypothetical protein
MECQSLVQERQHNCWSYPVKVRGCCAVSARRIVDCMFFNETINCERYLRVQVEGQRFQHILWFVNKGKNFLSFQMLSACWVIGSIRMRSTTSGAPVLVKHSAVNASSLLKKHPLESIRAYYGSNKLMDEVKNNNNCKYLFSKVELIATY